MGEGKQVDGQRELGVMTSLNTDMQEELDTHNEPVKILDDYKNCLTIVSRPRINKRKEA